MSQRNTDVTDAARHAEHGETGTPTICTVLEVLDHISGKWNIGVLLQTIDGPVRYTELERAVKGISRRMLTLTLRNLERDGLIVRTVYPTVPPKVEYKATAVACELYDSLRTMMNWAERNREAISRARVAYDQQASQEE